MPQLVATARIVEGPWWTHRSSARAAWAVRPTLRQRVRRFLAKHRETLSGAGEIAALGGVFALAYGSLLGLGALL